MEESNETKKKEPGLNERGVNVSPDPVLPMTQPVVQTEIITELPSEADNGSLQNDDANKKNSTNQQGEGK